MARIIHVDDEPGWISVVQRALGNHRVDSAVTYEEALRLLNGNAPYDLALVDLNLTDRDDSMGRELLDVLMNEYPATRRVVVTASVPEGAMRAGVFERFDLDDLIIKGKASVPGLQMVVSRALKRGIYEAPQQVKYHDSELAEQYRDWHDRLVDEIRSNIRFAENRVRDAGRFGAKAVATAEANLDSWLGLKVNFTALCENLESVISVARTIDNVRAARQQLEDAMTKVARQMEALQSP
jgi:CheY-like chemotaxis protein